MSRFVLNRLLQMAAVLILMSFVIYALIGFMPGDPIDVMILMDEPAFAGCHIPCRPIGMIEAEQTEDTGETVRNDRLLAVADDARNYRDVHKLCDVNKNLIDELGHFFESYHSNRGTHFKVLGHARPEKAKALLAQARQK